MSKKIPNIKSVNIKKQKYLTQYLIKRSFTLKDLKCEVILMVCDMLIDNYILADDKEASEVLIEGFTQTDRSIISETMKDLQKDIIENILTIDKIQAIINSQNNDINRLYQARLVDCVQYFYNLCVNHLQHLVISNSADEDRIKWIPDLLCIYLIQDMKEKDYPFNKFTFLDKYDLDNLFVIYQKTNIILKKKNKISMISQGKTIIDIMANISYDVVEKLVNSKYK